MLTRVRVRDVDDEPRNGPRTHEIVGLGVIRAATDSAAFIAAFALSYRLYSALIETGGIVREMPTPAQYLRVALLFAVIGVAIFLHLGLYGRRSSVLNLWEQAAAVKGVVVSAAWFFAVLFFWKLDGYSRLVVVLAIAIAIPLVIVERRLLAGIVGALHLRGRLGRHVVIYDCGATGRLLMKKIVQSPHLGYRVVGFLDDRVPVGSTVTCRVTQTGQALFRAPVLGRWHQWRDVVSEHKVDELLLTTPAATPDKVRELFAQGRRSGLRVGVVPQLAELRGDQLRVEDLSAVPVLRQHTPTASRFYPRASRVVDVFGALVLAVLTAPVWLAAAIAVRLDSSGPVLFVQERAGRSGRLFRMLKFRTMWSDAPAYAPSPAGDVDRRITRVGRVLRSLGVDELPQLWNVLTGDMALVGPRPEMPFIVARYTDLERQRLQVKPGITGIWQLSADRHAEIHENVEYDLYYINHQSLTTDFLILVETLFFTIGQLGRIARRRSPAEARPANLGPEPADEHGAHVLVALDQRAVRPLSEHWQEFVPALYALSARWPVKLLVAGVNVTSLDELLAPTVARLGTRGYQIEFFPYLGRSDLQAAVAASTLVVTDLPHVAAWAREQQVDALAIRDDVVEYLASATPATDMLRALRDALPQALPHTFTGAVPVPGRDAREGVRPPSLADLRRAEPPFREERLA